MAKLNSIRIVFDKDIDSNSESYKQVLNEYKIIYRNKLCLN